MEDMDMKKQQFTIVYYCTGHGLGHATRSIEICKHLVAAGHAGTLDVSVILDDEHL